MSQLSKLMIVTEDEKKKILEVYNITEQDFQESVQVLKGWISQNHYFPEDKECQDNRLMVALLNSKMSCEKAKKCLEGYLTVKSLYKDLFQKLVPNDGFRKIEPLVKSVIMPKLLPNLNRLQIAQVDDTEGIADSGLDYFVMPLMIAELRICNDFFLSNEILIDMKKYNMKNMLKFTPVMHLKLVHILTAINLRIHIIHIINASSIWDTVMLLLKTLLPTKLIDKIKIHQTIEELHEYIPKEYLPSNYGGPGKSLEELQVMWKQELEANDDLLQRLTKLKAGGVLKQLDPTTDSLGMGTDGSFKKLAID